MARPKCILIKLLETPDRVKVRVVGDPRRKGIRHCVVARDRNALGWKIVYSCNEYEQALSVLEKVFETL